jgi:hypothetical protein
MCPRAISAVSKDFAVNGFTIAANETQYWWWNWFSDAGSGSGQGPNKGPVIFRALPKGPAQGGNNTAKNVLMIYDFAKCRGGPGDDHAPAVFYEFKIRNESSITVPFDLEIILFSDLPINNG